MLAIITYDEVSNRRRAKLHRALKEFGLNTQKSVFECDSDDRTLAAVLTGHAGPNTVPYSYWR